jgi:hypothetical protein
VSSHKAISLFKREKIVAIIVNTTSPSDLLKKIKEAIDGGKVRSWSYDKDGDFTHDSEQWKNKAWLTPKVYNGELRFGILKQQNVNLSKQVYGLYHGRFIDMLLTHFDDCFTTALATAGKKEPDSF